MDATAYSPGIDTSNGTHAPVSHARVRHNYASPPTSLSLCCETDSGPPKVVQRQTGPIFELSAKAKPFGLGLWVSFSVVNGAGGGRAIEWVG